MDICFQVGKWAVLVIGTAGSVALAVAAVYESYCFVIDRHKKIKKIKQALFMIARREAEAEQGQSIK